MNCELLTLSKWIWAESLSETRNCYVYARREFEAAAAPSADVCVTCSTEYKLYVNGRYIGRGPNRCHPGLQYYDSFDLTHVLRPGKNVIAAICYNYGVEARACPKAPGGFLLQLAIHRNGDEDQIIATDETWRVLPARDWSFDSARMSPTIGFQEVYDSRKKPIGWNVVGYDDSAWEEPAIVGGAGCEPWTSLVTRQIPPLREWEAHPQQVLKCGTITAIDDPVFDIATRMYAEQTQESAAAVKYAKEMLSPSGDAAVINPGQDCFIVLDFGMEVVGFPGIKIRGAGRATIDFGYSEALDENGDVFPTRQGILQADRLVAHGGRQEWQTFGRRAFRYVQLTIRNLDMPISIESVYVTRIGYPAERVSSFECSDELVNEIWRTGVYTLSLCMQDEFEQCPLGKPVQRVGDARLQALINYYCFFDTALAAKALEEFALFPDHDPLWVIMLHDHYLHTADISLVTHLYPNIRVFLEHPISISAICRSSSKRANRRKCGGVAIDEAFHYQALRDASKLAAALSNSEDSLDWHDRAGQALRAFNERFWRHEKGVYIDPNEDGERASVPANTLAILFGLADVEKCSRVWDYLSSSQAALEPADPCMNFYVLQALAKLGKITQALDLIRSDWGQMLDRGSSPDGLCHGSSGTPTYFLPAEVLGIKPSTPGGGVVIQPRVGDLAWAKGHIKTIAGFVDVEWRSEDGLYCIDIEAPAGFIVALPVSGFENPIIDEIDLSPETPERRARRTYGWGTTIWLAGEEHDPYLDWLATQGTRPPDHYARKQRCSGEECYIWVRESVSNHVRYEVRQG